MARPVRLGDAGFIGGGLAIVPVGTSLSANAAADVDPAKMKVQRRMILQFRELIEPGRIQAARSTQKYFWRVLRCQKGDMRCSKEACVAAVRVWRASQTHHAPPLRLSFSMRVA
jgi:hypothetical protein